MEFYFSVGDIKFKIFSSINCKAGILEKFKIPSGTVDAELFVHKFDRELFNKITFTEPVLKSEKNSVYKYNEYYVLVCEVAAGKPNFTVVSPDNRKRADIYIDNNKWDDFILKNQLFIEFFIFNFNAFILHCSVVLTEQGAIAFSAPSQTGKSTQGSLWEKYEKAEVINGDKGIFRRLEDGWRVYGGPWAGTSGIFVNKSDDIKAVFVISQGKDNKISRLSPAKAFSMIVAQSFLPYWDKRLTDDAVSVVEQFAKEVPVYSFSCTPDQDAVNAVKQLLLTLN